MSYEKQYFSDGNILKAKHLNHIEDGILMMESMIESSSIENGGKISTEVKNALLECFRNVVFSSEAGKEAYIKLALALDNEQSSGGNASAYF